MEKVLMNIDNNKGIILFAAVILTLTFYMGISERRLLETQNNVVLKK